MRKSYKLSWFYHNHTEILHSSVIQNPVACTTSLKSEVDQQKVLSPAFTVSEKVSGDEVHSRYGALRSTNGTASSLVSNGTAPRQVSSGYLPPTWSILRYYLLQYKKYAQNCYLDPIQNVLENLCPDVLAGLRTDFQVNNIEKVGTRRRISDSKWQPMSSTQSGYGDGGVRGLMTYHKPTSSVNSSRLFHTSCHLPKADDFTYTVDRMEFEDDFTYVGDRMAADDRYIPRNTQEISDDTLSLFNKNRYHITARTNTVKSLVSKDHQFGNHENQITNLVPELPNTYRDKTLLKEKKGKRHTSDCDTQILLQKETIEEKGDDYVVFPKSGNDGKRMNETESNLKLKETGTVQENEIGIVKVLEDIDKGSVENGRNRSVWGKPPILPPGNKTAAFDQKKECDLVWGRKKKRNKDISFGGEPPILPPGNRTAAFDKKEDHDLVWGRKKKKNEEKGENIAEKREKVRLPNGNQKAVDEGKKRWQKLDLRPFEERTPFYMKDNRKVSDKGSEVFKMVENIPSNVAEEVSKYGLKPMAEGYTCMVTRCLKLPKKVSKSQTYGNLYINTISGHFQCDECQQHGTWSALQHNFENIQSLKRQNRLEFPCMAKVQGAALLKQGANEVNRYLNTALPLNQLEKSELEQVLETFECDKLSLSTLMEYNVRYLSEDQSLLLPYYLADGTLISAKKLTCPLQEDSDSCSVLQEFTSQSGKSHLFGWNKISKDDDSVILTANELDAMAITQTTNIQALALPMGISSLPIESLPDLERFKKILLWFENDLLSWKAVKGFARKLNDSRCYLIRPSLENPGPYRALQQGMSLKKIMRNAHQIMHESIVGYSDMKSEVYSELANLNIVAGTEWKRYKHLNSLLKGHRRGELTVFTGPTGSGKTTFMSEYSLDLCESGVRTLWGSFEIPNVKLAKVMLSQFAKKNLSTHLDEFDHWSKQFERLPLFFMTFHGHQELKSVIDAMTHAVYVHDIEHIIVDNLQFMMGSMNMDKFYVQDRIISSFRNFATTMNCHITVVIHPRKEKEEELCTASVFGSAKATQEADNIIILQDRRQTNPRAGKYIQVVKNRFDGDLGKMLLTFDKDSYTFSGKDLDTEKLKKQTNHQDPLVQNTEAKTHDDQSTRTRHSQNVKDIEQRQAVFYSDPEVKKFDSDSDMVNQAEESSEVKNGRESGDEDDNVKCSSY